MVHSLDHEALEHAVRIKGFIRTLTGNGTKPPSIIDHGTKSVTLKVKSTSSGRCNNNVRLFLIRFVTDCLLKYVELLSTEICCYSSP